MIIGYQITFDKNSSAAVTTVLLPTLQIVIKFKIVIICKCFISKMDQVLLMLVLLDSIYK